MSVNLATRHPEEALIGDATPDGVFITNKQLARVHPDPHKARRQIRRMLLDLKEPKIIKGPTSKPADVRIATRKDEIAVHKLVMMDLEENAKVAPIDQTKVAELIMLGTRGMGGIVAVIDGADGAPVAVQIIALEKWWWSQQAFLMKMLDYVHPEHRQTTHAAHLVQFAKWCSDHMTERFGHRVYLLSGVLGTERVQDKMRMYGRHLTPVGGTFLYPYPEPWEATEATP